MRLQGSTACVDYQGEADVLLRLRSMKLISKTTLLKELGYDYNDEIKFMAEETKAENKTIAENKGMLTGAIFSSKIFSFLDEYVSILPIIILVASGS